jgi:hypothetical protein
VEHAPLRPIPARPDGPVEPPVAIAHVRERLPALDGTAAAALALADLARIARPELCEAVALEPDEVGATLARARKELRRSLVALPASGWCERAELMVSDRLDDALEAERAPVLDVHLRHCDRCVEHERKLVQAIDELAAEFIAEHGPGPVAPPTVPLAAAAPPELRIVEGEPEPSPAEPLPSPAPPPAPAQRVESSAAPTSAEPMVWRALTWVSVAIAVVGAILAALGIAGADL